MSNYMLPTTSLDYSSSITEREKSTVPGLTLFDLSCATRKPLPETIVDETTGETKPNTISISAETLARIFEQDFKCPICLGTIEKTSTVTACLHRFCLDCIQKNLRVVKNEKSHDCPACRVKMASRRDTKPDKSFDLLIELLSEKKEGDTNNTSTDSPTAKRTYKYDYKNKTDDNEPQMDLTEYQKLHQQKVAEFKKRQASFKKTPLYKAQGGANYNFGSINNNHNSYNGNNTGESPNKRAKLTAAAMAAPGTTSGAVSSVPPPQPPTLLADPNKILFGIFPLPEWSTDPANAAVVSEVQRRNLSDINQDNCTLRSPYLRVPCLLKIGDLKQYLKKKYVLSADQFNLLEIVVKHDNKMVILDEHITIKDVTLKFWDGKAELFLFFRLYQKLP